MRSCLNMSLTPDTQVIVRPPTWSQCLLVRPRPCVSSQAPAPSTWSLQSPDKPPALTRSDVTTKFRMWSRYPITMPAPVTCLSAPESVVRMSLGCLSVSPSISLMMRMCVRCPALSLSPSELNLPGLGPSPSFKSRPGPSQPPGPVTVTASGSFPVSESPNTRVAVEQYFLPTPA